jgi:hypothetical protein
MKIPEGWPTDVMIEVGANVISAAGRCDTWDKASDAAKRVYKAMSEHAPTPPACPMCNGRGEIGGFVNAESGYQNDPCPECATPPTQGAIKLDADDLKDDFGLMSDRDMLNYLHSAFETEVHNCENCGFAEPTSTFDSASILRDYLEAHPTPPAQEAEPVYQVRLKGNTGWSDTLRQGYDSYSAYSEYERRILYTHAPSEKLRQAAEEALSLLEESSFTPERYAAVKNLRAELKGKS